jgi:hypothetical protein
MEDRTPHYLRFARALALATTIALAACSDGEVTVAGEEESSPAPVASGANTTAPGTGPSAGMGSDTDLAVIAPPMVTATAEPPDAGADASPYYGKQSGPLPPPEMPDSIV